MEELYLHDESLSISMLTGNTGPAPGKAKTYAYIVGYDTKPDPTPIEDLNLLYELEGQLDFHIYDAQKDKLVDDREYDFSLTGMQ